MVTTATIEFSTDGAGAIVDLTDRLQQAVLSGGLISGTVTVLVPGSTGAITAIEYEPGLLEDLPEFLEKLIPSDQEYEHDRTWHDGNGFSHLRAALIGPSETIPVIDGRLALGQWQQVVFLEFDNKSRSRRIIVQMMGEKR